MIARCGVKNARGKPCQLEAGWGTDHKGYGPCKWHENNIAPSDLPPLMDMVEPDTRGLLLRIMEEDQELFDLRMELSALRMMFVEAVNNKADPIDITRLARSVVNLASAVRDMEHDKHLYIHVEVLAMVLQAVGQVAAQYIPDKQDRRQFSDTLRDTLRRMLPEATSQGVAASALSRPVGNALEAEVARRANSYAPSSDPQENVLSPEEDE